MCGAQLRQSVSSRLCVPRLPSYSAAMVLFSFAGVELMALPQGALFWPARRALLVADLHFEKASFFARLGQMLPPYDSIATLADLAAIVAATIAARSDSVAMLS